MKITMKMIKLFADSLGLTVDTYNPGDNLTIKILNGRNQDYFSGDGLIRCKTIREADCFLQGYKCSLRSLPKLSDIKLPQQNGD